MKQRPTVHETLVPFFYVYRLTFCRNLLTLVRVTGGHICIKNEFNEYGLERFTSIL